MDISRRCLAEEDFSRLEHQELTDKLRGLNTYHDEVIIAGVVMFEQLLNQCSDI
jgi:hypothetical protein